MGNEKEKFIEHFSESLKKNSFVKILFGKYRGDDKDFQNILVTKIEIKESERLSFRFRYKTKDVVKNFESDTGIKLADEILGKDFFTATLFTLENDFTLDYSKKRTPILHIKKATFTSAEISKHNRAKTRFIDVNSKYLELTGITTSSGKIIADKYDKFKQVDKFIETMDALYRSSELIEKEEFKITDMGSGKSYLTFAVYEYFANVLGKKIKMTGIEQRDELVNLSNDIALKCGFSGLKFDNGTIENFNDEHTDIVIALHACDTATDDAICKALNSNADIIILAPCCHKYVRKKMKSPDVMKGIYRHGILSERLGVMLTDGLRALVMEYFGYETKIFEFISSEHTAKNTMITAVKKKTGAKDSDEKLKEINAIRNEFEIADFYLDKKLF